MSWVYSCNRFYKRISLSNNGKLYLACWNDCPNSGCLHAVINTHCLHANMTLKQIRIVSLSEWFYFSRGSRLEYLPLQVRSN